MNLVPCRECRHSVSRNARSCPECGAPFPARQIWNGWGFEWKSRTTYFGYPLIHVAFGRDARGKLRVAKGIIAVGQFAIGMITVAQFGIGFIFGLGQFILAFTAIAQFAGALYFALGQFAIAYAAVGQIAVGYFARCQIGFAKYLWSMTRQDPEAVHFFRNLLSHVNLF
ncbi:hypothetical protein JW835_06630 [bacterium]|nr:hypothetical protein [bacterium]